MGKVTRKRYSADFKAKVALEAIKGEQSLAELAAKHGIHQTMIATWKRQAIEEIAATFSVVLKETGIKISMDGRGRWMDNVFIERLWRSITYECVYRHAFETGSELRAGLSHWVGLYNERLSHSAFGGRTPDEAHRESKIPPYRGHAQDTASIQLAA